MREAISSLFIRLFLSRAFTGIRFFKFKELASCYSSDYSKLLVTYSSKIFINHSEAYICYSTYSHTVSSVLVWGGGLLFKGKSKG